MPISSFRLKGTIGRNYKTDFEDTLRTKEALRALKYYEEPSYGMTGYPDEPLFGAIENFQRDHGLQRDGIMRPGGETVGAIGVQLASLRESAPPEGKIAAPNEVLDNTRVAASGTRRVPFGPPLPLGPVKELGDQLRRWWDGNQWPEPANGNERTSIANPIPPLPPQSPPPKIDNKTEFPASGPEVPSKLITPIPSAEDPNILIYPTPDEGLTNVGNIVEDRRETEETKAQHDDIRDWFYETHDPNDWDQYGGRDRLTGKEKPEYYIPGPAGDFTREDGHTPADGRKGSRRPDLTFINKKTGQKIHFQTADVDKNDQVAPRERAAEADIWRLESLRSRHQDKPGNVQLHIIPKNAQMKNYKPIP
jgi:hypothetical protein